jgi:dTDP-4-amino-4,6-dideoxygalactose transaminase
MSPRWQSFRDHGMSSAIPWASPLAQYRAHQTSIQAAINRVLDSGIYILGTEVDSFECAFAEFCGGGHAIGVASGTDALILALKALDIGPGDEVITVSHTAVATVAAILATGATPVLIDIDEAYMTLDPAALDAAVTPRSKAVIAVHLYGQAADLDPILASARRHGVAVIEDCAQATGGLYRGGRLGSVGDIGCFSFYPTKNLGAIGDGGMILTHEHNIADRAQRLRQYGWDDARESHEAGLNSRLDPLQAAILHAKLPHLDADNARRASIARRYQHGLQDLPIAIPKERVGILRNILMGEAMRSVRFRSWNRSAKRSRHAGLRWRKTNWRSVSRSIIPTISTALRHPSSGTWLSATRRISSMFRRANCGTTMRTGSCTGVSSPWSVDSSSRAASPCFGKQSRTTAETFRSMIEAAGLCIVFVHNCEGRRTPYTRTYYIGIARRGDAVPAWARPPANSRAN